MPIYNARIIRALAVRLRQPGMQTQRRFVVAISLTLALFVIGALFHLFRQTTEDAMEQAAVEVFAVMGILIAIVIAAAVVVRKRTGASWSVEEALKMAGKRQEGQPPKGR
jgi:uncharacterized membrane protein